MQKMLLLLFAFFTNIEFVVGKVVVGKTFCLIKIKPVQKFIEKFFQQNFLAEIFELAQMYQLQES